MLGFYLAVLPFLCLMVFNAKFLSTFTHYSYDYLKCLNSWALWGSPSPIIAEFNIFRLFPVQPLIKNLDWLYLLGVVCSVGNHV